MSCITKMMICDEDRSVYNAIVNKLSKNPNIDVTPVPHISSKKIVVGEEEKTIEYSYADIAEKGTNKWTTIEIIMATLVRLSFLTIISTLVTSLTFKSEIEVINRGIPVAKKIIVSIPNIKSAITKIKTMKIIPNANPTLFSS